MHTNVSIAQIEQAINYWRHSPLSPQDGVTLERNANVLADIYGQMIYSGQNAIATTDLSIEQGKALAVIL
ncbi:DUF3717 domain-containing protein [Eoetvoesiella caeni]